MTRGATSRKRRNHEPPAVTARLGWRSRPPRDSPCAASYTGASCRAPRWFTSQISSPARTGLSGSGSGGIAPVPEIVRLVPHIAFAVDDLDEALKGREILIAPTEPSVGVRVAFILDDGAPVELLQFDTAKVVRPKTRHAAESRAAPDDGAAAKEMRRRR